MPENNSGAQPSVWNLVLIPGAITLVVTILRLIGELRHWSTTLFNPAGGGGGGLVGIGWLVPIFGIYFAMRLADRGQAPASSGKALGFAFLGLLVMAGGVTLSALSNFKNIALFGGGLVLIIAGMALPFFGWGALAKALVTYGYVARVPVLIVMYFALRGNWGTHYDGLPPNFPAMAFWPKFLTVAVLPQMFFWVGFTIIVGSIFGCTAALLTHRGKAPASAVS